MLGEGKDVAEVCRELLKRLLADAELEKAALKEIARETSKPGTTAGGRRAPHPRDGRVVSHARLRT